MSIAMKIYYIFFLCSFFILSGCSAPSRYYINDNGSRNFKVDYEYCTAMSMNYYSTPPVLFDNNTVTNTQGNINIYAPNGMYTGVYSQQTTTTNNMASINNMMQIANQIGAMNRRDAILSLCLYNMGWRETTKEIHDRIISRTN